MLKMPIPPNKLDAKIRNIIVSRGFITIDEFMAICLYDDECGYYKTRNPIGKDADFITAPEISQMFGETIGIWLKTEWDRLNNPKDLNIIELGPGRGTLLGDALRVFSLLTNNCVNLHVGLVETNAALRNVQSSILCNFSPIFAPTMSDLAPKAKNCPTILIANEFLDCLPIKQFINTQDGWRERKITIDGQNNLAFTIDTRPLINTFNLPQFAPIGALYEYAIGLEPVFQEMTQYFVTNAGSAIFIDYGHISPSFGDSFQGIWEHKKTSPLLNLGLADLTAHVNFEAVAKAACKIGGTIETICNQAEFLCNHGILARAKALMDANPSRHKQIEGDLARIIDLDQMGELFKTIVVNFNQRKI